MLSIFSNVVALFITVPILALVVFYWVSAKVTKSKKRAFHMMIDFGAIVFIFAVHFIITVIWEVSALWIIALLLIFLALLIGFIQFKVRGDIELKRVRKVMLRLNFLLFSFTYIILLVYGIVQRIVA